MVAAIFSGVWGLDAGKAPCLSEEPMTAPPWTPPPTLDDALGFFRTAKVIDSDFRAARPPSALLAQQVLIACPR